MLSGFPPLTSPLGVAGLPWYIHGLELLALTLLGFVTFFFVCAILDTQLRKHWLLHWFRRDDSCWRCETDRQLKQEREHQKWLKKRGGLRHPPAALSIEKPEKGGRA